MSNTLGEGDRNLVRVDYSSLLSNILEVLRDGNSEISNPFRISKNGQQLFIDLDDIAYKLATSDLSKIENPLGSNFRSAKVATTVFNKVARENFVKNTRAIRDCLQQHLQSLLKSEKDNLSREDFLKSLLTNLTEFQVDSEHQSKSKSGNQLSFNSDFNQKYTGLSKQRLTLKKEDRKSPLLKFHRLTITIEKTQEFDLRLKESLENYIDRKFDNRSEREELEDILTDLYNDRDKDTSDWYKLKRLLDTEAIAKVQRTGKINYLEYLLEYIPDNPNKIYLEILINRLKSLEQYINDPNKSEGDYQVNYGGTAYNLKQIFSRAEAFDRLPIISIITGNLGESRDEERGILKFIFGLKLKLGGKIQTEAGKTVLEYNLNLLNPDSKEHQEEINNDYRKENFARKVLQIAVLYFFVFAGNNPEAKNYTPNLDLEYEVIDKFQQNILPILQGSDEEAKRKLFKQIIKGFERCQTAEKITNLKDLLTSSINNKKTYNSRIYPIQINVKQGILEQEYSVIDSKNTFFKADLTERKQEPLKYISVGEASIDTDSLCYLSGNIIIDELNYFDTKDHQLFTMEYVTGKFPTIPIVLIPQESECTQVFKQSFEQQKLIGFAYDYQKLQQEIFNNPESPQAFIYRFTFLLLAYISLKILLDLATEKLKTRLFIPILKLHLSDKEEPLPEEKFMRATFTILSHLINQEHRSRTQGFCIKNINQFKIRNRMSSLYSVLPKKFNLNQQSTDRVIDKLAIIVVSSRECDRAWKEDYKIANLMGEVIKIDRQADESILVYTSKTISEHYSSQQIYSDPDVLVREVERLYQEGYRHILYIAKSPYSQTLNLTANEKDEELYFMSSAVIGKLKENRSDLKIYPVFFDKYYAVSLQKISYKSLYIQDAEELTDLVNDPTKQVAVFFNLFNGIKVGGDDKYYNGVISYSTLLNMHEQNLLDTNDIYAGLIDRESGLKNEILQMLTLFHFSRYEADVFKNRNIQLKLDPYQNIIGSESIGALSIFPHLEPKVGFNSLAFLNEVADALDANLDNENKS